MIVTEHSLTIRDRKLLRAEQIIDLVCQQYNLTRSAMLSRRRFKHVAWARQVAMYLARVITDLDYETIAELFWRDSHGTPEHAFYAISNLISGKARKLNPERRAELCAEIECLRKTLSSKSPKKPTHKKP